MVSPKPWTDTNGFTWCPDCQGWVDGGFADRKALSEDFYQGTMEEDLTFEEYREVWDCGCTYTEDNSDFEKVRTVTSGFKCGICFYHWGSFPEAMECCKEEEQAGQLENAVPVMEAVEVPDDEWQPLGEESGVNKEPPAKPVLLNTTMKDGLMVSLIQTGSTHTISIMGNGMTTTWTGTDQNVATNTYKILSKKAGKYHSGQSVPM